MRSEKTRRFAAEVSLLSGLGFTLLGAGVLIVSASGGPRLSAVPASLCVLLGTVFAFAAVRLHRRSRYLFFSALLIQIGLFLVVFAAGGIDAPLSKLWPVLSIFAGLALIPAGWHRYGAPQSRFIVPAIVFVLLGGVFLVFAFRLVPFSFKAFFLAWWPLLLLIAGVILTLVSLSAPGDPEERGP
ncbi:MAG: hypothetical protein A2Z99_12640 [Treponema sp. GWB1_62_6]|nr:MAG: hypothetical protein A2Y36_09720 [Treponema sp. GWA1_62_8]OHE64357.1 MAG: hypothetical protein A2001_05570 [Treponema sp. GWC1_61_84]OHE68439.1 MAG: hypothetical protein A2413_06545 [Treponema sp. RIFOXYC1_FULL_61_9]OHE70440.1 MAG: hypothetical protein A2Z99_12640 [Treponema sp. GWB1_62_6]HCM27244.1 hypothetical protein [Treponema sp.]